MTKFETKQVQTIRAHLALGNIESAALDFVNEPLGYFQDMRHEAVNHARAMIKQLAESVQ